MDNKKNYISPVRKRADRIALRGYSAIDAGTTVFGDAAIRALYDDANDLGKLFDNMALRSANDNHFNRRKAA
ncbi:MAG: hypothetical protein V1721_09475 [Pseudomonadota bacterium]